MDPSFTPDDAIPALTQGVTPDVADRYIKDFPYLGTPLDGSTTRQPDPVAHIDYPADYWTRRHVESVVLDIGGDVGALVLYTSPAVHGQEIEVSPPGSEARRVHAAVLERTVNGRVLYAAVYPELAAGEYIVWYAQRPKVTVLGGAVAEVYLR